MLGLERTLDRRLNQKLIQRVAERRTAASAKLAKAQADKFLNDKLIRSASTAAEVANSAADKILHGRRQDQTIDDLYIALSHIPDFRQDRLGIPKSTVRKWTPRLVAQWIDRYPETTDLITAISSNRALARQIVRRITGRHLVLSYRQDVGVVATRLKNQCASEYSELICSLARCSNTTLERSEPTHDAFVDQN